MPSFDELVQVLAHLCNKRDVDDQVSFHAAIAQLHLVKYA